MKKKILCFLSGLLFLTILSFPLLAEPLPYYSPPPAPRMPIPPSATPPAPPTPSTPLPATTTCPDDPADPGVITINMLFRPPSAIQTELDNFMVREVDGVYKLCFNIQNGPALLTSGLSFNHTATKPVLISGLQIRKDPSAPTDLDLFTINTSSSVTLINSDIQGLGPTDEGACLAVTGAGHTIRSSRFHGCKDIVRINGSDNSMNDVDIQGTGASHEGACLILQGSGHIVKNSKFHGCAEGILIEGSNMQIGAQDETRFDVDKNEIYANNTGIHWVSGINDRFAFNKIYNNPEGSTTPSPDNAIGIDSSDIIRPDFAFKNDEAAAAEKALRCTINEDGAITSLFFQFEPAIALAEQEIVIYKTMQSHRQMEEYFTKCTVGEDGKCPITVLPTGYSSGYDPYVKECFVVPEIKVVALVNAAPYTSMLTPKTPRLRGPIVALGGGGEIDILSPPSSAARGPAVDEESGAAMAGPSGVSTAASSGGCGGSGGGATIVPPDHHAMGSGIVLWWLIFTTPAVLLAVRIGRRR